MPRRTHEGWAEGGFVKRKIGLAAAVGLIGAVGVAAPAHAAYSVTARASNTGPDAGSTITISGQVSGGGAARKVVEQYWNGSRWVPDKVDSYIPGGQYSVSISRAGFGTGKYRAVAVDGAGRILGASPTVTVGWFAWMNLSPQQGVTRYLGGNENKYFESDPNNVGGPVSDAYFGDGVSTSAAGVAYPQSILFTWERSFSHDAETSIYGMRYSLHRLCTDVRFAVNLEARSDPAFGSAITTWVDGAMRQENHFQPGAATVNHRISVRGGNNIEFRLGLGTSSTEKVGFTTVGTPQARCKGPLPAQADQ